MARKPRISFPALPCPMCMKRGHEGICRIGNRPNRCKICNNWQRKIVIRTSAVLKERFPEEYERAKMEAALVLYKEIQKMWEEMMADVRQEANQ